MGEWKAPLSLRVRVDVRREMETFAARERRTLGNLGEVLIEWILEKLKAAGSTERLLNAAVPIPRRRRDDAGK
jgi:hypothetical protein